ncbi:MAG: uroporphyrinogen-III synthase [Neptuniibacter sp.]
MPENLNNCRVIVTRPEHQSQNLINLLQAQGAEAVQFPLLQISAIEESSSEFQRLKQKILDLDLFQHVIFISPNAASFGYDWIDHYWPQLPIGIQWFAIGKKTAETLSNYGIDAYHSPLGYDSEALLLCPALKKISGEKVLIMRGQGGRETLANELRARGAEVSYAELYIRSCPEYDNTTIVQTLDPAPDCILFSSGAGLENLVSLINRTTLSIDSIKNSHIIVPSDRINAAARAAGFKRITTASGPDDQAMLQALMP